MVIVCEVVVRLYIGRGYPNGGGRLPEYSAVPVFERKEILEEPRTASRTPPYLTRASAHSVLEYPT